MKKTSYLKKYYISLFFVSLFSTFFCSYYARSLEEGVFQKEMDGYTRLLERFISQDWSIIALKNNASGTLTKELNYFVNKNSECLRFFDGKYEVGNFGNCLLTSPLSPAETGSFGWFSYGNTLVFRDNYRMSITMELTMDNPEGFYVGGGSIKIPFLFRHVYSSSYKNILWLLLLFSFAYAIFVVFETIKAQRESSKDKVHDFSNLTEDSFSIADEITSYSENPLAIREIATRIRCVATLKEAVLYDGPADKVSSYLLGDLLEEFLVGFFDTKDKSVFTLNPYNETIYIQADKRLFMRALSNLFDNAFKVVFGKGHFHLTLLESPDKIDFVVSNKGVIQNPKNVFKAGFSNRGSSGRGLAIVNETVSCLGSEIYLTHGGDEVSFSFSLPISKEKSWPALYA